MTDLPGRVDDLEARLDNLGLADLPLAALQRKLENDWQPDANVLLQPKSITAAQLSDNYPVNLAGAQQSFAQGKKVQTMGAVGAGAVAQQAIGSLPFNGKTPTLVIAQFTDGGTIFFSDQYVIGTYNYAANGFSINYRSAVAELAGWTIGVNYIAYF